MSRFEDLGPHVTPNTSSGKTYMDAVRSLPQRSDPCCSVCGILSRLKVLRVERILLLDSEKVCVDIVARLHGTPLKVYNFRVSDSFAFYRTHSCPFDAYGVEVGA